MDQEDSTSVRVYENVSAQKNPASPGQVEGDLATVQIEEPVSAAPVGAHSVDVAVNTPVPAMSVPNVAALVAPIATALADAVVSAAASAANVAPNVSIVPNAVPTVSNTVTPPRLAAPVPNATVAPNMATIAPNVATDSNLAMVTPVATASTIGVPTGNLSTGASPALVEGAAAAIGAESTSVPTDSGKSGAAEATLSDLGSSQAVARANQSEGGTASAMPVEMRQAERAQQLAKLNKNWWVVHSWKWPVACACILLGVMVGLQYRAQESKNPVQIEDRRQLTELVRTMESERNKMSTELKETRAQMVEMEEASGKREQVSKQLQDQLLRSRIEAGLTGMKGPGVVISMNDSPRTAPATDDNYFYIVHDVDLTALVNELWAAGAEAVCVNDQRIVTRSSIRCVGPAVLVNGVRLTAPYITKAIGSKDLETALRMPGGFLNSMAPLISKGGEVKMNSMDEVVIPPYEGSSSYRFGQSFEKASESGVASERNDSEPSQGLW